MIKKPFFSVSMSEPHFRYGLANIPDKTKLVKIYKPQIATFYIMEVLTEKKDKAICIGDYVKEGQRIFLHEKSDVYAISSISGYVHSINTVFSDHGFFYTAVSIKSNGERDIDESFKDVCKTPTLKVVKDFLQFSPGQPSVKCLVNNVDSIEKIIIYGGGSDILVNVTLNAVLEDFSYFNEGIKILKRATGISNISFVIPQNVVQNYSDHFKAKLEIVPNIYPKAEPSFIFYKETGKVSRLDEINSSSKKLCFIKSEAVSSIGKAFNKGKIPTRKIVTIVEENVIRYTIDVCIGTHFDYILSELNIVINDGDRVVFGGPLTGVCIYSLDHPISPDTETIIIQRKKDISKYSNYSCINCGSCVRVCPANVQVNLLVRFLEMAQYQEGAELYDLFSCIECGLCSYVCTSRIPISQYIKLAKYKLYRIGYSEDVNE